MHEETLPHHKQTAGVCYGKSNTILYCEASNKQNTVEERRERKRNKNKQTKREKERKPLQYHLHVGQQTLPKMWTTVKQWPERARAIQSEQQRCDCL